MKTVISLSLPHQAHIVKGLLEVEGIAVTLHDEFTVQVNNYYSGAVGGVKVQVSESDFEKAESILKSAGYIIDSKETENIQIKEFNKFTDSIPLLNRLPFELRIIAIATIVLTLIAIPVVFYATPSDYELLTERDWCIASFSFENTYYKTNTNDTKVWVSGMCKEKIKFKKDGEVRLPGFNTLPIYADWKLTDSQIEISNADTLGYIYNGIYTLQTSLQQITIQSEKTIISARLD